MMRIATGALTGSFLLLASGLAISARSADRAIPAATVTVDYPKDGSLFPPDFAAPTLEWRDSDPRAKMWVIEFAFGEGGKPVRVKSLGEKPQLGPIDERCAKAGAVAPKLRPEQEAGHAYKPDEATWDQVRKHGVKRPVTVRFLGYEEEGAKKPVSSGEVTLRISSDPVGAPIFYRDVPLIPVPVGEHGVIAPLPAEAVPFIAWRLMDLSTGRSRVMMQGLPTCANCHSFSRDGKWMGIDVDGPQNDKGLYALVPVRKETAIRNDYVIRWNSFSDDPAKKRFGFMSQISPDGQYLITSTEPTNARMKSMDERLFNGFYKDYGFGQVFYPTRGILSWYSKATGKLNPLPGADDPNFVQTSAFWSPDGKYLVYSRAKARDPYLSNSKEPEYANSPDETQIQYDLYRIPFNDGKGGKPEPVQGASDNGMSNNFPKVSPDGKWIVFVKNKNGLLMRPDSELYIVPFEGGTARRMNCNMSPMNSWHTFSPNGRWLAFSSKGRSLFTQLFMTHIDENGMDSPAILVDNATASNRAVNIPEFVNVAPDFIETMSAPATEFYRLFNVAIKEQDKGDLNAAIAEWKTALAMSPDEPKALYNLGVALAGAGHYDEALEPLRKALALKPFDGRIQSSLGIALARTKHPDEAFEHLTKAIELNPMDAKAQGALGSLLAERGNTQEAIPHFAQALELDPKDADTQNNIAVALVRAGRPEAAIPYLEKALEADPNSLELHANMGLILSGQGRYDEAIPHLEKALSGGFDSAEANRALGRALAGKGRIDEALPYFEKALATMPESIELHYYIGRILSARGRAQESLPHLERVLKANPDAADVLMSLAIAQLSTGHGQEAIGHLQRAVALRPDDPSAHYNLGSALFDTRGAVREALAEWGEALRLAPDYVPALNRTARLLATCPDAALRNGSEAVRLAERAVELSRGGEAVFLDTLAAAYAEQQRFREATETERRALALVGQGKHGNFADALSARISLYEEKKPLREGH
jgi:tetratricopeptide (TPR) repeat protein